MASSTRPAFHALSITDAASEIDALFASRRPGPPVAKSTPEQMAFARSEARKVRRHDGLMAGERLVNGEVYVFNADARDADIAALLASRALQIAAE